MGEVTKERDEMGRFVKGVSGNPAGKGKGVKNKTNLLKDWINHNLTNDLEHEAKAILAVAIRKAKEGDNAMIKLLIKDLLTSETDASDDKGDMVIKVRNMTLNTETTLRTERPRPG